jgi:hypothetical protein
MFFGTNWFGLTKDLFAKDNLSKDNFEIKPLNVLSVRVGVMRCSPAKVVWHPFLRSEDYGVKGTNDSSSAARRKERIN